MFIHEVYSRGDGSCNDNHGSYGIAGNAGVARWIGFDHTVGAGRNIAEGVAAVGDGGRGGWLHARGYWVAVDIIAGAVLQSKGHVDERGVACIVVIGIGQHGTGNAGIVDVSEVHISTVLVEGEGDGGLVRSAGTVGIGGRYHSCRQGGGIHTDAEGARAEPVNQVNTGGIGGGVTFPNIIDVVAIGIHIDTNSGEWEFVGILKAVTVGVVPDVVTDG